ncbi:inner membrane protein YiaA [Psychrobacter sp. I-STPA6b]|uniref:inner membrane protein YiaA n=1 Tax=Psychrobacter sp. I-STPA6b TaxID=2585718 RepID=UPI001D0C7D72|nr:inner membrane protein YiaA [Psychrobacter sp. I-STPA6b]
MNNPIDRNQLSAYQPTAAYVGASWAVMLVGILAYLFGLWNAASMQMNEKGYYLAVLALGLYAAISLQKTLRDKSEGIPTTNLYYWISWAALALSVALIIIGLFNAESLSLSEKGFYLMSFTMSLFAAITIQKNTRDTAQIQALVAPDSTTGANTTHLVEQQSSEEGSLFGSIRSKMTDK